MGFFKGMKGSASPNGGDSGGGGPLAQLLRDHAGELQSGGDKAKYTYDANTKQYNTTPMVVDGTPPAPTQMKKGGTASSRADGCCTKGKTKGRMI